MRQARHTTMASALALALAALASPAAGQQVVVDYPTFSLSGGTVVQERGLDEPVPPQIDLDARNRQEAIDLADRLNRLLSEGGTCPVRYEVVNGTRVQRVAGTPFTICGFFAPGTTSFLERRVFEPVIVRTIDNRSGSPGEIRLRGLSVGNAPIIATATSLVEARTQLALLSRTALHRRQFVGTERFTGGGPVTVTDVIVSERLTGRDTASAVSGTLGAPNTFIITGTRANCPTSLSTVGCTGGVELEVPTATQSVNVLIFTTLYITQSVERTLTGGTTFFDVPLTPLPSGAVHALAAQGGLAGGQRFLDRLGDHAALVDRRGLWGEIAGSRLRFDAAGPLAPSAADGMAARLGFDLAAAPGMTLGLAGEYASDDLAIADPITPESGTIERWSLGAHARLDSGRLTASLAAQVGTASIDTSGASDLGAARADYDATTYGVAGRIGVRLGKGPLTLTPEAGASWNRWERDGFVESGGPAPLTVLGAADEQTRLWAGGRLTWETGPERRRVTLAAYGRAVRVGGDRSPAITAFDPQLPDMPLVTLGPQLGETRGEYGASATLGLGSSGSLRIGWDAASDGNLDAHALTATVLIAL